jgi:hypothetical protein
MTMTRALQGAITALLFSAALGAQAGSQQQPPPPQQSTAATPPAQKAGEVTLVGCVAKGTSAGVFILEDAVDPAKKDDTPRTLKLASSGEELDFQSHLSHKVQIVGMLTPRAAPTPPVKAGEKVDDKELQVFTVKTVTPVATTCSATGQ